MFSKRSIERLAGALLLAGFVAFLGHGVTAFTLGAGPTTILFVLLYGFLVFLSAAILYQTFRSHERTLALFGACGLAAHGLFTVLTCALLLAGLKFPEEFAATFGAEHGSGLGGALESTMDKIRTLMFVFLGLGLVPLGALIAWSGAVARWVGWLGVVSGTLGFLGAMAALFDVVGGAAAVLIPVAVFSMFVFVFVLGIRLVVRETHEPTGPGEIRRRVPAETSAVT